MRWSRLKIGHCNEGEREAIVGRLVGSGVVWEEFVVGPDL